MNGARMVFAAGLAVAAATCSHAGSYKMRVPKRPQYVTPANASREVAGAPTGFFHFGKDACGKWWFIDPKGVGVFPTGVQSATFNGCRCEHGGKVTYAYRDANMRMFDSFEAWANDACGKLRAWSFNMLGHGSSLANRGFIEAPTAALGYRFWHDAPDDAERRIGDIWPLVFPNVFHPGFADGCRKVAEEVCAPRRDDPWLLGWFIDNEVSWRGKARGKVREDYAIGLFDTVAAMPPAHSARKALDAFLATRGETAQQTGRETKVAFLELAADRYFSVTAAAIRKADPNHLVLGCRFIQLMELEVWPVCAKWCDAISVNLYPWVELDKGTIHAMRRQLDITLSERLDECGRMTGGKPILITEWSFLAFDSGLPCTEGSGQRFYTQEERAAAATIFARTMAAHPLVAGWTFFRWVDQPRDGISDTNRENGNYGLLSESGKAYPIAEALGAVQRDIAGIRSGEAGCVRFRPRFGWEPEVKGEKPPHWNAYGKRARTAEISGFGKAKVKDSAEGVDVESAVGAPWSGVSIKYARPVDVSGCACAVVSVTNLSPHRLSLVVGIVNGAGRKTVCRDECMLEPFGSSEFKCSVLRQTRDIPVVLEGMMGYGKEDVGAKGRSASPPSEISALTVYRRRVTKKAVFRVLSVRFDGTAQTISGKSPDAGSFFPFCDRFGQYRHAEWPGKIHSESELAACREEEGRWLAGHSASPIACADRFGGWATGPQLAATGLFRTEKVNGKWWLVDPDGHLFFSHGIAGVRCGSYGDGSPLKGRERYFEWLPPDAHDRVSFQRINLVRKYGADPDGAIERDVMRRRLRAWGINTIGNWSSSNIWTGAGIPYTDHITTKARSVDCPKLAGNRMPDVFAPEFARNLDRAAAVISPRSGSDPWCVGWFVDNELSWGVQPGDLAQAVLAAPEDQPARKAFVKRLEKDGKSVEDAFASDAILADLTRFFAERYFSLVRAAVAKHAPGRLYLGCRFCSSRVNDVVHAVAAKYCDVISANIYRVKPTACAMISKKSFDRPYIVGEFHFGALDRGMMHACRTPARDQSDRAAMYRTYVEDALASDRIVGAHWFLLRDQALTGRPDGECFQCGFIDVADTPYPEMVEAARSIASTLYPAQP